MGHSLGVERSPRRGECSRSLATLRISRLPGRMDVNLERCAYVRDSVSGQAAEAIDMTSQETRNRLRLEKVGAREGIAV